MDTNLNDNGFAQQIDDVVKKNIITYQNDPDRIISDYRGEKGLTEAYNGRQLLELLQNADDAKTSEVLIILDTQNKILSIANKGEAFDIKGVKSLMLANTSSKNKREFIGNKGLGFRSVLNWVSEVRIKTQGTTLIFSPQIAAANFETIVTDAVQRQRMIDSEKDLVPGTVPFAVLAIPKVEANIANDQWTTVIELSYKEGPFEEKIIKQLAEIKPEILLFLNHTKIISIAGAGKLDKTLKLGKPIINDEQFLAVNGIQWQLFDSGELVLNQDIEKYYRYKIAWKSELSDRDTRFFTYFPTQVTTRMSYLIHATFDLDPTRNHLNRSDDNEFILAQIAGSLGQLSITKLRAINSSNWKAYQFLSPAGQSDNEILKPFYDRLLQFRNSLPIFPCIDGSYRKLDEVKFYSDDFSNWIIDNGFAHLFQDMLLPLPSYDLFTGISFKRYSETEWNKKVNELSALITSIKLRAELISMLLHEVFKPHTDTYALLINKDGRVIKADTLVFTPIIQSAKEFSKPAYLEFDFINRELYDLLVAKHKSVFQKNEPDAREFQRLFKELVNIQPYDSNNVISRIIRGTRRELALTNIDRHPEIVKEMVQKVFENFKTLKDRPEVFNETFPLLERQNEVRNSAELHLNSSFPSGKLIEVLYQGVFTVEDYVQDIDYWELDTDDYAFIESFFVWMGVNKYVKFNEEAFEIKHWENNPYKNYAIKKIKVPEKVTYYKLQALKIDHIEETLGKLTIPKLIVLLRKDEKIYSRLDTVNPDKFYHTYGHAYFQEFAEKPSYIHFQLSKLVNFSSYIIENADNPFIKTFSIEEHKGFFAACDVKEEDVKAILMKLGAKNTFLDLHPKSVFQLLKQCAEQITDVSVAGKLYRQAFNNFRLHNNENFDQWHTDLRLLAIKNGQKEYRPIEDVYYSDNTTLPSKIISDYWMFSFPKRSGEKQVERFFGVKTFKDISINVIDHTIVVSAVETDFLKWLEKIKPYLLAYRLNGDTASIEKTAAALMKNITIKLVSKANYFVDDNEPKELLPGEFLIMGNNNFMICAPPVTNLQALKEDPAFCEAFAEVLCVLFSVSDGKDEYRNVFKDRGELKDTQYLIHTKSLNDKLISAKKLLGLSAEESTFWNAVFALSGIETTELLANRDMLIGILKHQNFTLPNYYGKVSFETFDNKESADFLKLVCDSFPVSLPQLTAAIPAFPALKNWHLNRINNKANDVMILFDEALWQSLNTRDEQAKRTFINTKNSFKPWLNSLSWHEIDTLSFDVDYQAVIITKVEQHYQLNLQNLGEIKPRGYLYSNLLAKYNIEFVQLDDCKAEQSLLFFEGYESHFDDFFKTFSKQTDIAPDADAPMDSDKLSLNFAELTDDYLPPAKAVTKGNGSPVNNDHGKRAGQQKKAGKKAELIACTTLRNDNYEVIWVSGNSTEAGGEKDDSLGYDMRYKKQGTDDWSFLEVKSISGHSFIISSNEIRVALDKKEKYHLGLVQNGELNIVEDFFTNESRVAKFNELLNGDGAIRPIDFEVYFNLNPLAQVQNPEFVDVLQN